MKNFFVTNTLWRVISTSSALSKTILVAASVALIVCLFIFIYKLLLLREKNKQVSKVKKSIQSAESLDDILSLGAVLKGTLPGQILGRGLTALKALLYSAEGETKKLTTKEYELLQDSLDQALEDTMRREEEYLPILSVCAAVSPLVGLFGTISGLIQSFIAIGQEQSANIATIAPGIAEALLTTFAGLVVAIPVLIMFHYLTNKVQNLEYRLASMVHRFEWIVKKILTE